MQWNASGDMAVSGEQKEVCVLLFKKTYDWTVSPTQESNHLLQDMYDSWLEQSIHYEVSRNIVLLWHNTVFDVQELNSL